MDESMDNRHTAYEKPQALRLGGIPAGVGLCASGSGDDACYENGYSPGSCYAFGLGDAGACDPGSVAGHDCVAGQVAGGQCISTGNNTTGNIYPHQP